MEVKEVFKIQHPETGKLLSVALSEQEVKDTIQAGLFYLMRMGWISINATPEIDMPEDSTPQ